MKEQRRVFVKHREMDAKVYRADVEKDGSNGAHSIHLALLSINRWGIYGAYKMLKLKAAWFKVAEKKNKTPTTSTYINYDDDGKIKNEDENEKEESDNESEEEKDKEESEEESEESENESEEEEESEKSEEESEKSEEESEEEK